MKGGKVEILVNDQGNRITPSYVAWNDDERLVGDAGRFSPWPRVAAHLMIHTAKNQFASNPLRTVYDIKRLIGRKFADKDVQRDIKHFPFKVVNKSGQPRVEVEMQKCVILCAALQYSPNGSETPRLLHPRRSAPWSSKR